MTLCNSTGKIAFTSPEQAEAKRRRVRRFRGERMTVYRCKDCRCWHVGHIAAGVGERTTRKRRFQ